jgi:hypothetical protein
MSNLLLETNRKTMRRNYMVRLVAVATFLLAISIYIGSALLLPSFFLVKSKLSGLEKQAELEQLNIDNGENPRITLQNTKNKLELLSDISDLETAGAFFSDILEEKTSNVSLTSITFTREGDKGTFIVSGVSKDRKTLVDFTNKLERSKRFTNVALPVSNLAGNKDILFSLSMNIQ